METIVKLIDEMLLVAPLDGVVTVRTFVDALLDIRSAATTTIELNQEVFV